MRDYRGKRKDTGEWVYGFLISGMDALKDGHLIFGIVPLRAGISPLREIPYTEIIPSTEGEFTGVQGYKWDDKLPDDEDVRYSIYTGDIVEPVLMDGTHKGFSWGRQVVVFDRGAFCLKDRRGQVTPMCNYAESVQLRVLGNVHDNPELMEV